MIEIVWPVLLVAALQRPIQSSIHRRHWSTRILTLFHNTMILVESAKNVHLPWWIITCVHIHPRLLLLVIMNSRTILTLIRKTTARLLPRSPTKVILTQKFLRLLQLLSAASTSFTNLTNIYTFIAEWLWPCNYQPWYGILIAFPCTYDIFYKSFSTFILPSSSFVHCFELVAKPFFHGLEYFTLFHFYSIKIIYHCFFLHFF